MDLEFNLPKKTERQNVLDAYRMFLNRQINTDMVIKIGFNYITRNRNGDFQIFICEPENNGYNFFTCTHSFTQMCMLWVNGTYIQKEFAEMKNGEIKLLKEFNK